MALTTEQLKNIHLMQKIYVLPASFRHRDKPELQVTKVNKVGTKYFHTEDGRKWELDSGRNVTDHIQAELFINEKDYTDKKEMKELWVEFYRKLSHHPPKGVTLEEVKAMIDIVEKK